VPNEITVGLLRAAMEGSGANWDRSHCRLVLPLIHFIPDSLTYSAPLFLKRQCDRTLGAKTFLIDGYPRNNDNLTGWDALMAGKAVTRCVLFFDCPVRPHPGGVPAHFAFLTCEKSSASASASAAAAAAAYACVAAAAAATVDAVNQFSVAILHGRAAA
jgi:hypothetical protein